MATTEWLSSDIPLGKRIAGGVVGGIAGGLVMGALQGLMGSLPMIASIVGSNSAGIGFLYHMFNSVVIGALFSLFFGAWSYTYSRGAVLGLVYGVIWWVLGPKILMPLMLGMGLTGIGSQIGATLSGRSLISLLNHLVYGLLTGVVYAWYVRSWLEHSSARHT